jgi:DNA repair protein SbcD/Mre11
MAMVHEPVRFLQAGDFHLEQPLSGVEEVPDALRELFLESPYRAAVRVFDAAVTEGVDFLVLTGDLLDPVLTGPRGPVFLAEQFTRLAEREIPVYWVGGTIDPPESWPTAWPMPGNVHVFSRGRVDEFLYQRNGTPRVRLMGTSHNGQSTFRPGEFHMDAGGLFTIAAVHGDAEPSSLHAREINYWALGGRHERHTPTAAPSMIHYCGSPQGRHPGEAGSHGCTLVEVDGQHQVRTSLIPTDIVRWFDEFITVEKGMTAEEFLNRLSERMVALRLAESSVNLLVSWTVAGSGPILDELHHGPLARQALDRLRNDFGAVQPAAWSISLHVQTAIAPPARWREEESLRGDFLRILREWQINPETPLAWDSYFSEAHRAGSVASIASVVDPMERERVLREAALLGIDLLGGPGGEMEENPA